MLDSSLGDDDCDRLFARHLAAYELPRALLPGVLPSLALRRCSKLRSQPATGFQLAPVWSTITQLADFKRLASRTHTGFETRAFASVADCYGAKKARTEP